MRFWGKGNIVIIDNTPAPTSVFLLQWVIVNPLDPRTYEQADAMLRSDKCAGLKFHPEEHCYTIKEYGEELFKFGAARGATILVHSGDRERPS